MFKIFVKLNPENLDYEQLHPLMERHGFSRVQQIGRDAVFYTYKSEFALEEVYALVVRILAKNHKQFCVFVHEVGGGRGMGMAG
jgi:hypothetical protein